MTFLDLTVRQVEYLNTKYGVDVPLILMNSFRWASTVICATIVYFNVSAEPELKTYGMIRIVLSISIFCVFRTHEQTVKILNKYQHHNVTITCFTQSSFPRIDRDHYTPLPLEAFSQETVR